MLEEIVSALGVDELIRYIITALTLPTRPEWRCGSVSPLYTACSDAKPIPSVG